MPSINPEISVKISTLLKNSGKISEANFNDAKKKYDGNGKAPLGILEYLINDDLVSEDDIVAAVSRNYALRKIILSEQTVKKEAVKKLPKDFIMENEMLPFELNGRILKIALFDPTKSTLAGKIKSMTGCNVELYVAKPSNLDQALKFKSVIEATQEASANTQAQKSSASKPNLNVKVPSVKITQGENAVVEFVDKLLNESFFSGTSDIHIEIFRRGEARVRFRKDGVLQEQLQFKEFLMENYNAVITRLKIMSGCDISEKRLPQDGKLQFKNPQPKNEDDVDIDVRFSVIPAKEGERVVMRLLAAGPDLGLEQIGLDKEDYDNLVTAITAPQGMVLVTGPTGSGKSTTLYGCIKKINSPGTNIMTAEDPVEFYLKGVGQIQANNEIGLTFEAILKSFLRQDPEVILVGEIRDKSTVDIAIKAALTGHLLLSTLHTNDAVSTVVRLVNMGVPSFMVASALSLIVAQRLARKNCSACLVDDPKATKESLLQLGFKEEELSTFTPKMGEGCAECNNTGYKGRQGIYEVLKKTPNLEAAILRDARGDEMLEVAVKDGFKTMQVIGRNFIKKGILSVEEYSRILVV
ncbi:GspE/PulE family protein [Candidatus Pelagibacter sp. HIMB1321]|uniref:GspE/PulE family protein n=1 Tax=Candidatus Pelagibacter sp. HIMB1321 TaxID=1388755 RepID=UPI000A0818F2|nr:ATPase, T2SS/T4P/T4SS family [Candidatus Pelagibacter sp. HIMB1321]SMF77584.1 type IV pilus assembly protein PilB [Candidatus Pelagibacter sp. HIMB1321]